MTVAGILSGVTDPYGAGYVLSRIAARLEPVRTAVPGTAAVNGAKPATWAPQSPSRGQDRVELSSAARNGQLTPEQQQRVVELRHRDAEVRQHEAAHQAAAGAYARGGARFEYQAGPDGQAYAVGGEVDIDTSPVPGDPDASIRKMQTVRAAALAPDQPSAQDRRVAAEADAALQRAEGERNSQPSSRTDRGHTNVATAPSTIKPVPRLDIYA
jgi:hypothetical protein